MVNYQVYKRVFDLVLSITLIILFLVIMILIAVTIKIVSPGAVFYWSNRVGRDNKIFSMVKFRTMKLNSPEVSSDLLPEPSNFITPVGFILRRTSLDELPQLWNVLKGEMSFVGPRPALFNQDDLIKLRLGFGLEKLLPGLTGWAQVNGRDKIDVLEKVKFDFEYMERSSFLFDLKIIWITIFEVILRRGISH